MPRKMKMFFAGQVAIALAAIMGAPGTGQSQVCHVDQSQVWGGGCNTDTCTSSCNALCYCCYKDQCGVNCS